jgi:DNA-binding MarR family transcriptional regulator
LEGIAFVSKDVVLASEKFQTLINQNRLTLLAHPNVTIASIKLLEELPQKPFITLKEAVEKLGLTKPPVSKAIKILIECEILIETTGKKKDRQYSYRDYLNLLAADTEL